MKFEKESIETGGIVCPYCGGRHTEAEERLTMERQKRELFERAVDTERCVLQSRECYDCGEEYTIEMTCTSVGLGKP